MGRGGSGVKAASEVSIEITFMYRGKRCRERLKLKPSSTNLKRAERHRAAILVAIENGTFDYAHTFPNSKRAEQFAKRSGDVMRVGEYLTEWLGQKEKTLKASTLNDYVKTVNNHLIPAFGDITLTNLKRGDIRAWCADMDCSNKRIANLLSPLRTALQDAFYDDLIESNPIYGWKYTKQEGPKDKAAHVDPFNLEEQRAILGALEGQAQNLIRFAFWTGMRTSELVALEWRDIDWTKQEVRVTRALTQASSEDETTKTASGTRSIKLLPDALIALDQQKQFTWELEGRVFHNPRTCEPWIGDQAIRRTLWMHALKRAGVRYRNPYQTRHTYASMMLTAGEPLAWLSSQMGHSNVLTTARIYARFIQSSQPEAGSLAVKLFTCGEI